MLHVCNAATKDTLNPPHPRAVCHCRCVRVHNAKQCPVSARSRVQVIPKSSIILLLQLLLLSSAPCCMFNRPWAQGSGPTCRSGSLSAAFPTAPPTLPAHTPQEFEEGGRCISGEHGDREPQFKTVMTGISSTLQHALALTRLSCRACRPSPPHLFFLPSPLTCATSAGTEPCTVCRMAASRLPTSPAMSRVPWPNTVTAIDTILDRLAPFCRVNKWGARQVVRMISNV